jgi:diadenosine tetraphosphate (Ap4A) HIT family hydrolase
MATGLNPAHSPFADPAPDEVVLHNDLCYARWDQYPVTEGHLLIVPYRVFTSYFDATTAERAALWTVVEEARNAWSMRATGRTATTSASTSVPPPARW